MALVGLILLGTADLIEFSTLFFYCIPDINPFVMMLNVVCHQSF